MKTLKTYINESNKYCNKQMKTLKTYINESIKSDALSDWYEDEYWEIKGDQLPLHVTNNIYCSFSKLDDSKPLSVFVQNEQNKYTLTFGNIGKISGTFTGFNKTMNSGVIIKTLENCVLSIRSGGEKGNRNSCEVVTREPIVNVLKYFKRNNSEEHFSKVVLSRFICDGYDGVEEIANAVPSLLIEFSECIGLQKFNFENDRKGLMFYTDKSTVNGKLKLNGMLNDKDPKIKVVMRKSDIIKMEAEAEKSRIAQINSWADDFDIKKCERDLKNAWEEDDNEIRMWIDKQANMSAKALNYLKISWKLEDEKSYDLEGIVKKHVEYKLNDKNQYEQCYSEGSSSFNSYVGYIEGWVDSNIHKYGTKPYLVIIEVGRELVG